jgi:hypothetical protein
VTPSTAGPPPCWSCGAPFTPQRWLGGLMDWWARVNVTRLQCPACGQIEELSLADGGFERGYTYAAGSPHFAGMEPFDLPGLRVTAHADALEVTLDGETRRLVRRDPAPPAPPPTVNSRSGRSRRPRRA